MPAQTASRWQPFANCSPDQVDLARSAIALVRHFMARDYDAYSAVLTINEHELAELVGAQVRVAQALATVVQQTQLGALAMVSIPEDAQIQPGVSMGTLMLASTEPELAARVFDRYSGERVSVGLAYLGAELSRAYANGPELRGIPNDSATSLLAHISAVLAQLPEPPPPPGRAEDNDDGKGYLP